jgi:hypothetical protein
MVMPMATPMGFLVSVAALACDCGTRGASETSDAEQHQGSERN